MSKTIYEHKHKHRCKTMNTNIGIHDRALDPKVGNTCILGILGPDVQA